MWAARSRAYTVLVVVLLLAHFALRPLLIGWTGAPDLLTGALLLGVLRLRAGYAAALGFVLGLLEAAMALKGMGAMMLVYTVLAYVGARSRDLIFAEARVFVPLYLFVGVWLTQVAIAAFTDHPLDPVFLLLAAPLSAASTALVCWLAVRLTSPVFI